jgi:hypothetical protein
MRDAINRRRFLEGTAAATTAAAVLAAREAQADGPARAEADVWPAPAPVRIFKVYAGRTGDSYLTRPTEELGKIDAYLAGVEKKLGNVRFVGGDMVPPAKAAEVAARLKTEADALLIVHLSHHGGNAPELVPLVDVGLPTALFSQPFSGHGWMDFPQWRKEGKRVMLLPTSDWTALDRAAALLRAPSWMKQTRILAVGGPNGTADGCDPAKVKARLGAEVVPISNDRVMEVYKSIDPKAAEAEAESYWLKPALKIIEPKRPEIIDSTRLYLAIKQLMIAEKAQAITSRHCMGDPRGCLSFSKLNDLGLVGACEGDIDSTLTMLMFAYAFGVPGFITDPVIDTAKNAIVHFHCTSATKMDGPAGERLPFVLRNQTDTRGGVAVQVANRVGQPVTCAKLVNLDTMLCVTGKITETGTSPLACRTQFTQSVPDARRLFHEWGAGVVKGDTMTRLHRVVFYGDHAAALEDLGALMGFRVVTEGGPTVRA